MTSAHDIKLHVENLIALCENTDDDKERAYYVKEFGFGFFLPQIDFLHIVQFLKSNILSNIIKIAVKMMFVECNKDFIIVNL